uniref:Putative secreted protein n=1 Tax=Anopheles darlingi TaxID=43151 RepID=A0A2M4DAB7_ANODA
MKDMTTKRPFPGSIVVLFAVEICILPLVTSLPLSLLAVILDRYSSLLHTRFATTLWGFHYIPGDKQTTTHAHTHARTH